MTQHPPSFFGKRLSWTQPCCDWCFHERYSGHKNPVRLKDPNEEKCVDCGRLTVSGIYIRINPDEAKFPTLTKDDA